MRFKELLRESVQTISLEQLYQGEYPDRDEDFWEYVRPSDFKTQLPIQTMQRHMVMITMLSMYQAEHIDEVVDLLEPEQREIVQHYENDSNLSNSIVVVCDDKIIDGNHRALAAALKGVSIKYVELVEEDEDEEIDEEVNPDMFTGPFKHHQEIGEYDMYAKFTDNRLYITCKLNGALAGQVEFEVKDKHGSPSHLESDLTLVFGKYQKRGIASMMYAYAKMLGNDIKPSPRQLAGGKAMWDAWKKAGDAKHLVGESELDPTGWGGTPQGTDVDYFGAKVKMRPSMFLKLAAPLTDAGMNSEVAHHMERGGKIAYPFLDIQEPDAWTDGNFKEDAKVRSHEGRNRMKKWIQMKGDEPIQVNLFFRGANRARYIKAEMLQHLAQGMFNETGQYVSGPLFSL